MAFKGLDSVTLQTLITAEADLTVKITDSKALFYTVTVNKIKSDRNDC